VRYPDLHVAVSCRVPLLAVAHGRDRGPESAVGWDSGTSVGKPRPSAALSIASSFPRCATLDISWVAVQNQIAELQ
jgi:hypothetical protein